MSDVHPMELIGQLTDKIAAAIRDHDRTRQAQLRLERAHAEWRLAQLYGPWSSEGEKESWRCWDDIEQAVRVAAEVARQVGDSGLVERLFKPYPALRRIAARPPLDRSRLLDAVR